MNCCFLLMMISSEPTQQRLKGGTIICNYPSCSSNDGSFIPVKQDTIILKLFINRKVTGPLLLSNSLHLLALKSPIQSIFYFSPSNLNFLLFFALKYMYNPLLFSNPNSFLCIYTHILIVLLYISKLNFVKLKKRSLFFRE